MSPALAVVSQTGETLSFYDLETGVRTHHLEKLISEPHELCHDSKRNVLYLSHTYRHGHFWKHGDNSHEISIIDLDRHEVVDVIDTRPAKAPHGLSLSPDKSILYASVEELPNTNGGGIIAIDLASKKIIKQATSEYRSHWFVITPDGRKAYTCNKDAPFISIIDFEKETMIGKVEIPSCEEPSISKDGRYAFFPTPGFSFGKNPANPEILVIDTQTDQIVKTIKPDSGVISVNVGSHGDLLVAQYHFAEGESTWNSSAKSSAKLAWYDGNTFEKKGEAPIGLFPLTIRSSEDGKIGFSANVADGTVSVIDLETKQTLRTILVDDRRRDDKPVHVGAHGLAFIP